MGHSLTVGSTDAVIRQSGDRSGEAITTPALGVQLKIIDSFLTLVFLVVFRPSFPDTV